jgi:hypothetical protein
LPSDFAELLFNLEMDVENDPVNIDDVTNLLGLYAVIFFLSLVN